MTRRVNVVVTLVVDLSLLDSASGRFMQMIMVLYLLVTWLTVVRGLLLWCSAVLGMVSIV